MGHSLLLIEVLLIRLEISLLVTFILPFIVLRVGRQLRLLLVRLPSFSWGLLELKGLELLELLSLETVLESSHVSGLWGREVVVLLELECRVLIRVLRKLGAAGRRKA